MGTSLRIDGDDEVITQTQNQPLQAQAPSHRQAGIRTAADVMAGILADPHASDRAEASYRRGCDQAMALASDLIGGCATIAEARTTLARAEDITSRLRADRTRGNGCLLDEVRARLRRPG